MIRKTAIGVMLSGDPNGFCQSSVCVVTSSRCGFLMQYPCKKTCFDMGTGTQPTPDPGGNDN